jgi:hypothetical protein
MKEELLALLASPPPAGFTMHKDWLPVLTAEEKTQLAKELGVATTTPHVVVVTPAPPIPTPTPAPTSQKPKADAGKYEPIASDSRELSGTTDSADPNAIYEWRYISGAGASWWGSKKNKGTAAQGANRPVLIGMQKGEHTVGLTVTVNGVASEESVSTFSRK